MPKIVKIVVFVPLDSLDFLRQKIGDNGFGKIGNYSHCAFVSRGVGFFKPSDSASPSIGDKNVINQVDEARLEFVCYESQVKQAIEVIKTHHPYEEAAIDIIPLLNHNYL